MASRLRFLGNANIFKKDQEKGALKKELHKDSYRLMLFPRTNPWELASQFNSLRRALARS